MSGQKRKNFTFDEEDMEWINPLILEWVKENEGKNQSDFVKELMADYREKREGAPEEAPVGRSLPSVEGIKDYMERIPLGATREELGSRLEGLSDTMKDEYGKLAVKVKELEAGARLRKTLQDFFDDLRPRINRLLESIRKKLSDLSSEIEKLRTRK